MGDNSDILIKKGAWTPHIALALAITYWLRGGSFSHFSFTHISLFVPLFFCLDAVHAALQQARQAAAAEMVRPTVRQGEEEDHT